MPNDLSIRNLLDRNHPLTPLSNRVLFTSLIFLVSIFIATFIIELSEGWTFVNSFYYIALITTTNGAPFQPTSWAVKIFTSLWAYFSFILLATIVVNAFGPLVGHLIRDGGNYFTKVEEKVENVEKLERTRTP